VPGEPYAFGGDGVCDPNAGIDGICSIACPSENLCAVNDDNQLGVKVY
jgi:hypothetical protein